MRWLDVITDSRDMGLGGLQVGDGQGGLVCCDSWGRKESDTTERLHFLSDRSGSGCCFLFPGRRALIMSSEAYLISL